ncbi:MAG: type IV toxin-antitoxin system AbiEi family antitoxin domain-containing protein, partial [Solirubrobacteraceae bacterium]
MGTGISKTRDQAASRIAARQNGNITRGQLLGLGMDDRGIAQRVGHGRLFRVYKGVYAVGRPPVTPVERAAAAVLACGERALLSHAGALALWGLTRHWPGHFDVTLVAGDRRPQGITVHLATGLTRADARVQLGVPVTSLARTVLDCAADTPAERVPRLVN